MSFCAVVKSFYSIGSVFRRVAGRCLHSLQRAMVDPLLTALRISLIFFFSATKTAVGFDAGEPPAWIIFQAWTRTDIVLADITLLVFLQAL